MIRHIFKTFLRSATASPFQFTTIVLGLSIGIAVSLLIFVYVKEESSFDRLHRDAARIFRIDTILEMEGKVDHTAKAGYNTGEALMDFFPEIETSTQVLNVSKQTIKVNAELHASEKVIYADSNFFSFFSYPFVSGNFVTALDGPNKVVISSTVAEELFGAGAENALGKTMNVNNNDFQVTGVYDQSAIRTHIPNDIFLSISTLPKEFLTQRNREFMWLTTYNYIKFKSQPDLPAFNKKLISFNQKYLIPYIQKNQVNGSLTFDLEPVTNIHLNPSLRFDFPGAVNPNYLSIFSAVALLTLFIALINYINLTTAKVSKRLKEIGIKKAVGALKRTLLFQFYAETILTMVFSFLLGLIFFYLALPELNALTDHRLSIASILSMDFLVKSVCFIILFGLLAGLYPSILLSSFQPLQALQANVKSQTATLKKLINPSFIRKILVTVQFSISVFLITGTIVIYRQFSFMQNQDMGFAQDQVLVIDIPSDTTVSNKLEVIKNKLSEIAAVKSVSAASSIPGTSHGALTMNVSQSGGSEIKVLNTFLTDEKFIEALDIKLKEGRYFSKEFSTDPQQAFVINEAAAKFLGWDNAIDKKIVSPLGQEGKVVGVVKDFNYKSLHSKIEPLVIMNTPNSQGFLLIKISTKNIDDAVHQISEAWQSFDPSHPYEYFFLDEKFQSQYLKEQRLSRIFTYFSSLAIFISCLGLIGLAIFTNELKTREIAIRKTLGANKMQVLILLSREFLLLIILANIIAWPASYYLISNWLDEFAYKMNLSWVPFILSMILSFAIALFTISFFANKAAREDIVKALKYN
jgi:putative ABC transport system permease protein